MKKFLLLFLIAPTLFFSSCKDENAVNPEPLGKTIITGKVTADFDRTNNVPKQTFDAVVNTKLIVKISDGTTTRYNETTTNGTTGEYTVDLEIGNVPLDVTITVVDFTKNVTLGTDNVSEEFYAGQSITVLDAVKGGFYIRDIKYDVIDVE